MCNYKSPFLHYLQHFFESIQVLVSQGVKKEEVGFQIQFSKQELRMSFTITITTANFVTYNHKYKLHLPNHVFSPLLFKCSYHLCHTLHFLLSFIITITIKNLSLQLQLCLKICNYNYNCVSKYAITLNHNINYNCLNLFLQHFFDGIQVLVWQGVEEEASVLNCCSQLQLHLHSLKNLITVTIHHSYITCSTSLRVSHNCRLN